MTNKDHPLKPFLYSDASTQVILGGKTTKDIHSLSGYLQNFDAGRAATPPSDFYENKGLTRDGVRIRATREAESWADVPRVRDYDLSRLSKYGPQGFVYPLGSDEQIEKLTGYFTYCHERCRPSPEAIRVFRQ